MRASCWAGATGGHAAEVLQARAEHRGAALDLGHQRGARGGRGLGVEHAGDALADADGHAHLGVDRSDGLQVVLGLGDVLDHGGLAGAVGAPDDAGGGGHAVEDLPEAAHGLAAQAAAVLQVHAGHQAAAGEVLDDGLGGLADARGGGQLALEAAGGAARRRDLAGDGLVGPRRTRAAEQPALAVVDLRLAQDGQLLGALDALGDDPGADLAGEGDGGAQHGLAAGVEVDAGDHSAAELEEVGADLGHVLERGEAGAGVVDGDQRAAGDPRPQPLAQLGDVLDGVLLGELDHQPGGQLGGELHQAGMAERVGRDVDEQQAAGGRRAGLADGGPAGDLEVVADAEAAGGGERHVRRERDQAGRGGEAGEALVADRLEVAQADDRLEDGADRAGLEQLAELVDCTMRGRAWLEHV